MHRWGSAPDSAGGAYSAPPDLLAGFKGPTSKGKGGDMMGGEGKGRWVRERDGREGGRKGRGGKDSRGGKDGREGIVPPANSFPPGV